MSASKEAAGVQGAERSQPDAAGPSKSAAMQTTIQDLFGSESDSDAEGKEGSSIYQFIIAISFVTPLIESNTPLNEESAQSGLLTLLFFTYVGFATGSLCCGRYCKAEAPVKRPIESQIAGACIPARLCQKSSHCQGDSLFLPLLPKLALDTLPLM